MGSSSSDNWLYDVFLSFRGDDVRNNFLAHLLKELDRKMISAFRDNKIEKGESLDPVLKKAIKYSRIAVVIFSKEYASSGWCLNELLEIINCKVKLNQLVIPIFYNVNPSHVRNQTKGFGKVFDITCINKTEDEIRVWRNALTKVAELVGYHSVDWENESKLIEEISIDLMRRLGLTPSKDFKDYLGIEDHIGEMSSLLKLESDDEKKVRMVGIWGPSGIGKTIIARALESRLSHRFPSRIFITRAFISTIRESYSGCNPYDYNMMLHFQESLLSKLLENESLKAPHLGAMKEKLKHRKVLIFIDDLDDPVVLEALAGKDEWFGHGSIIIAITKDRQILRGHGINKIYEVAIPSQDLALQILCRSAFKQNSPPDDDFMKLASEVAVCVGRLPLGLVVIGSFLAGKVKKSWEDILPTLQNCLNAKIEEVLRISYEGLERLEDKKLFRHIACFFNGSEIKNIKLILADGELDNFDTYLENLVDKSLVRLTTSWNNTYIVEMHCLIQEMGKSIVRKQSEEPGEREFVMHSKDVCRLLKDCLGTQKVLGISLDLDEIDKVEIHKNAFERMSNLRFLRFYKSSLERKKEVRWILPACFTSFSKEIRLLNWPGYPMKKLPHKFCPENLVEFRMSNSKLKNLWKKVESLTYLKVMDLSDSKDLKEIHDLSEATNLETLKLHGCSSLVKLPSSIQKLDKLTEFNLTGCSRLKKFPNISSKLESLIANRTSFQYFSPNLSLENLVELHMDQIKSERLWGGVKPLTCLKKLVLGSKNLKKCPDLSLATRLETLSLNGCSSLEELSHSSIQNLSKLTTLEMIGCSSLKTLPTDIDLKSLYHLNLNGCSSLDSFPNISTNISRLDLNQTSIMEVPQWIKKFLNLESMDMSECKNLVTLPSGIDLQSLYRLNLSGCSRLSTFPSFSSNIITLFLNKTSIKEVPHWISNLSSLEALEMMECKELRSISHFLFKLENLDEVFFSNCENLAEPTWPEEGEENSTNLSMISFTKCFTMNQETFIKRSTSKFLILPGEVPSLFTHRSSESSLIVPLHHSYLSTHSSLDFKACVVVSKGSGTIDDNNHCFFLDIKVQCRFRDKHGNYFEPSAQSDMSLHQIYKYNHMIIFDCHFPLSKRCDQVVITFHLPNGYNLEKCGMRFLDYSSSTDNEIDESICDGNGGYEFAVGEEVYGYNTSDGEGYETALDEDNSDGEGYETALDGDNNDDDHGEI